MDDHATRLAEIAQQLAILAALAEKLSEQPVFPDISPANDDRSDDLSRGLEDERNSKQ
jgi:hypothetical protein